MEHEFLIRIYEYTYTNMNVKCKFSLWSYNNKNINVDTCIKGMYAYMYAYMTKNVKLSLVNVCMHTYKDTYNIYTYVQIKKPHYLA